MGEEDKAILVFKLTEEPSFGLLRERKKAGYTHRLIRGLVDFGALQEFQNEKGFRNLELAQTEMSDEQIILLEQAMR